MKKLILLLCFIIPVSPAFCQWNAFLTGVGTLMSIRGDVFSDILIQKPPAEEATLKTMQMGTSFGFVFPFPVKHPNWYVNFGLEVSTHNLYSDAVLVPGLVEDTTAPGVLYPGEWMVFKKIPETIGSTPITYTRNKLTYTYLEFPLEVCYKFSKDKSTVHRFKISAGLKTGVLLHAHTKYIGNDIFGTDPTLTIKKKDKEVGTDLKDFTIGPTLRIGYSIISVYAYYSATGLFKKDSGYKMRPLSVGLTLSFF